MDTFTALKLAAGAAEQGNLRSAQALVKQILHQDPKSVGAWLLLAEIVENPDHARQSLERVLILDPGNETAQQHLLRLLQPENPPFTEIPDEIPEVEAAALSEYEPSDLEAISISLSKESQRSPSETNLSTDPILKFKEKPEKKTRKKNKRGFEILLLVILMILTGVIAVMLIGPENIPMGTFIQSYLPGNSNQDVWSVIYENINAANAEDIDRYMATIHPFSPKFFETRNSVSTVFDNFDLAYEISRVRIIAQTDKEIMLSFKLTTRKIRGDTYVDNETKGTMTLRNFMGSWKIFEQDVNEITRLK
jgi:hypothetical protein